MKPRRKAFNLEIKLIKNGYEAQVKHFNVRQAIDQQEINSFFMLVPKEETRTPAL